MPGSSHRNNDVYLRFLPTNSLKASKRESLDEKEMKVKRTAVPVQNSGIAAKQHHWHQRDMASLFHDGSQKGSFVQFL